MADHLIQGIDLISTLHNLFDFKTPFSILLSSNVISIYRGVYDCVVLRR